LGLKIKKAHNLKRMEAWARLQVKNRCSAVKIFPFGVCTTKKIKALVVKNIFHLLNSLSLAPCGLLLLFLMQLALKKD